MKLTSIAILCGLCILSSSAFAQGGYIGASIGKGTYKEDVTIINEKFDESDTGFKIFGGYRFNDNIALEGFYTDYGKPSGTLLGYDVNVELDGFGAYVVGILPFGTGFEVFGKAGFIAWDASANIGDVRGDADDTDFAYGVGVSYFFDDHFGIQGEWEAINFDQSGMDADMLSVGIQYRF